MAEERTGRSLYTIGELAQAAGVTPRTIRFYAAEGLLPTPEARGKYALYSPEHLDRLRLIGRLKEAFLPLGAIRAQMEKLTGAQVRLLLEGGAESDVPSREDAQEQTARLLRARSGPGEGSENIMAYAYLEGLLAASGPAGASGASATTKKGRKRALWVRPEQESSARVGSAETVPAESADAAEGDTPSDTWQRVQLAPGVELHIRVPDSPDALEYLDRKIAEARALFRSSK